METQTLVSFENNHNLTPAQLERVQKVVNEINIKDSSFVIGYGAKAQKDISQFADKVMEQVKTKDSGEAGAIIAELMLKIKEVDANHLTEKGGISSIPLIGSLFNKAKKIVAQYEKVSVHIEKISQQLDGAQVQLMRDITMLDGLYERNKSFFEELNIYIEAGEIKLQELKEQVIPSLQEKAKNSSNPEDVQELNDMVQLVDRFEKKLYNLKLSKNITIQTAPQIRLVQKENQVLAEKIQSSILQTIPLWKNQLIIALSLFRQQKALEIQKEVTDTTNDLLLRNSELLKQGSIEVARENEKGIVEIETLKATQANLIATLEETLRIQQEGKQKRKEAEAELANMEVELKNKLLDFVSVK